MKSNSNYRNCDDQEEQEVGAKDVQEVGGCDQSEAQHDALFFCLKKKKKNFPVDKIPTALINRMVSQDFDARYPSNVGILAMEAYFPATFVDQTELEQFDGVAAGKYTIGLGQTKMSFCDDREDINSICLTVVKSLMDKYQIPYDQIGRLEVGTETIIDKSKSAKSVIMQLFQENGNTAIEGIDTTNACYGGTAALFNAISWVESSYWDGRFALVVAGDIAVYASGNARPTGGAGVIALLVGPDAPVVFDRGLRGTHMEHVYDFYKPDLSSEFPEVDGPLTISCYLGTLDKCYERYLEKLEKKEAPSTRGLDNFDFFCFHSPYTKLVQKSFARLAVNDFLRDVKHLAPEKYGPEFDQFKSIRLEDSYFNKDLEKAFTAYTKQMFKEKTEPTLLMAKNVGNTYCGSLYGCLSSLLSEVPSDQLVGRRIGLFSYGSGLAASMFSVRVVKPVDHIARVLSLSARLESRTKVDPAAFEQTMNLREETHNLKNYQPTGNVDNLFPGTFYLTTVDEKYRRFYSLHL